MTINEFKTKLKENPSNVAFSETIELIEAHYDFTPSSFLNGDIKNQAGENSGSCKVFAFAKAQSLTKEEALACFGAFYFEEVLNDPTGTGHQNIRNFMNHGFDGLAINGTALSEKGV
jgi:hypothetical protein